MALGVRMEQQEKINIKGHLPKHSASILLKYKTVHRSRNIFGGGGGVHPGNFDTKDLTFNILKFHRPTSNSNHFLQHVT